jgi:hypothetical protein
MSPAVASEKHNYRYHPYLPIQTYNNPSPNIVFFQSMLTLDLSNSHITLLPNLAECMPNLQVLRCFNVPIKYITCRFPESLERALFDGSQLRYVSSAHVPNSVLSLVDCAKLCKAPLPKSVALQSASLWWNRHLASPDKIRMDNDTRRNVALSIIQDTWRRRRQLKFK